MMGTVRTRSDFVAAAAARTFCGVGMMGGLSGRKTDKTSPETVYTHVRRLIYLSSLGHTGHAMDDIMPIISVCRVSETSYLTEMLLTKHRQQLYSHHIAAIV